MANFDKELKKLSDSELDKRYNETQALLDRLNQESARRAYEK